MCSITLCIQLKGEEKSGELRTVNIIILYGSFPMNLIKAKMRLLFLQLTKRDAYV